MGRVAVAGGSGGLGRAVVEAIVAQGNHYVTILARQVKPELEAQIGASVTAVDYSNVETLTRSLEDQQIDTVISTIALDQSAQPELNLIRAAEASKWTKRFIPSSFGNPATKEQAKLFPPVAIKLQSWDELSQTTLEYTRVNNGYFLDYWGVPKVKSYLQQLTCVVDMDANFAAVPGSGDVPVVFTHTFDIAKYVAAALDSPKWEKESYIVGDKVTWNEFVKLAEVAKGTPFRVTYDSVEKLNTFQITELPSHVPLYPFFPKEQLQSMFAVFGLWFEAGVFDFKPTQTWNEEFPDIKSKSVKALLEEAWRI